MEDSSLQPWLTEPNFAKWCDPDTGLECAIIRHPELKQLNGYVRVPDTFCENDMKNCDVHGGITFFGKVEHHPDITEGTWAGFDCAHFMDLVPGVKEALNLALGNERTVYRDLTYRNFDWVKKEVTSLAHQVAAYIRRFQ